MLIETFADMKSKNLNLKKSLGVLDCGMKLLKQLRQWRQTVGTD